MGDELSYKDWHIPLARDEITLREAQADLARVGAAPEGIPLMVQLVENPKYSLPGITLFHGAVDLEQHDFIHLILGRGLLPKDEAFAIGFTMGSTKAVSTTEEALFGWISKNLYPNVYRFQEQELEVFRDAVKLGFVSDCQALDVVDFHQLLDLSLAEARARIGLETDLLMAYYAIEQRRYRDAPESQRLL